MPEETSTLPAAAAQDAVVTGAGEPPAARPKKKAARKRTAKAAAAAAPEVAPELPLEPVAAPEIPSAEPPTEEKSPVDSTPVAAAAPVSAPVAAAPAAEAAPAEPETPPEPEAPERLDLHAFQKHTLSELYELGIKLGLRVGGTMSKHQLVFDICSHWGRRGTLFDCEGILEVTKDGFGVVRDPIYSFRQQPDDVYISPQMIKRFALRTGNYLKAVARAPREKERFLSIDHIVTVENIPVDSWQPPVVFEKLTPLFPRERIILENPRSKSLSTRVVDIVAPMGKGQRALICAPPRGGKTILLKEIAVSIRANHPEVELMVLLLDERPEEVTDFKETIDSVVYASTFDQPPDRHIQVAEIVLQRAMKLVEHGKDVVILLDSLTRLARAYNNGEHGKGPIGSGGLSPKALARSRRFFGAARSVEEGGSLTVLATALIETDSRMDDVIFEEFKGTGNMEIRLDRELVERRIFPAINIRESGTRNDDRLYHPDEFRRIVNVRRQLAQLPAWEAMEVLVKNLRSTQLNAELLLGGGLRM